MRKVVIVGHHGAGKVTLALLLDGHPELRACMWQENFIRIFVDGLSSILQQDKRPLRQDSTPWFKLGYRGREYTVWLPQFLRLLVNHTYYSLIAAEAHSGASSLTATAADMTPTPLLFDFPMFDKAWKDELFCGGATFTIEMVIDALYRSLLSAYIDYPVAQRDFTAVYLQINNDRQIRLALDENFDTKFLIVRRPVEKIWATYCKRLELMGKTRATAERDLVRYYGSHPNARIDRFYDEIARRHPDKVICLDMAEFVENTDPTMLRICEFLGIADHEIVHRPTFQARDFVGGENHIGTVNDTGGAEQLSAYCRKICGLHYSGTGVFASFLKVDPLTALQYARVKLPGMGRIMAQLRAQIRA